MKDKRPERTNPGSNSPSSGKYSTRLSSSPAAGTAGTPLSTWTDPERPGKPEPAGEPGPAPAAFGRYRVEQLINSGGFGQVYLGWDDKLHRWVAVKVPRSDRIARPKDRRAFLAEARVLAETFRGC